jgi:cell division protein FtsW
MWKRMFHNYDYSLIVSVLLLCGFGLLMVYSASMVVAVAKFGEESDYFFINQLVSLGIGLLAFFAAMIFPYKAYQKFTKLIVLGSMFMLVFVLLYGQVFNNAQSWINIAGFQFQPAEVVKLGLIVYLASVFSKKQHYISNFSRGVMPPLIVIVVLFMLIAIQPDLGTAMIVAAVAGIMIVCSGMRFKHLSALFVLAGSSVTLLFLRFLSGEQASRFTSAYAPFSDPTGDGWQLINSYYAIASGGLIGRGLGESIQKYGFLPEAYTDFIMAVIAEELGLFGVLFVIGLLGYIVVRGFMTGIHSKDTFGSLLAIGISGLVGVQAIINLGAVSGLLPVTGIPLPFISYGGSSLVVLMFSMGILVNISMFVNVQKKKSGNQQLSQQQLKINQRV